MATSIVVVGGPAAHQEILKAKLTSAGFDVVEADGDAAMICCTESEDWDQVAVSALWTPTVVVLATVEIDSFTRALALGASVVHLDTPASAVVHVVKSAMDGEALLPATIAQALAFNALPNDNKMANVKLTEVEVQIVDSLLEDETIGQIAQRLSYSERTIRRRLNGIYLKLGVADRGSAIRLLRLDDDSTGGDELVTRHTGDRDAIDLRI